MNQTALLMMRRNDFDQLLCNGSGKSLQIRVCPGFFDQVGHQTTNASIGNKYFFTK